MTASTEHGMLLRKASLLAATRAADWLAVYLLRFCQNDSLFIALVASILFSMLLTFLFLRRETGRQSGCPAYAVALSQVGALLELFEIPFLFERGSCNSSTASSAGLELQHRSAEENSFSSSTFSERSSGSIAAWSRTMAGHEEGEDPHQLRQRILRKLMIAQVPESVCSVVMSLQYLMHSSGTDQSKCGFEEALPPLVAVLCGVLAVVSSATGIADLIISMCLNRQMDLVQENRRLVILFFCAEICSWWTLLAFAFKHQRPEQEKNKFIDLVIVFVLNVMAIILLILRGFFVRPRGNRHGGLSFVKSLMSQVCLATTVAPLLVGSNVFFFDNALTFRALNKWYYPVRYVHIACYVLQAKRGNVSFQVVHIMDPLCCLIIGATCVQVALVWFVVPSIFKKHTQRTAEEFDEKTLGSAEASTSSRKATSISLGQRISSAMSGQPEETSRPAVSGGDTRSSRASGLRTSIFFDADMSRDSLLFHQDSIIAILNAVGDTFEALLLASAADSPRVRSAVLGVAIRPLREAGPAKLGRLLPLILPQLLLALRWRTVEDGEDELCPLSSFVLEKALSLNDKDLVCMVYWQLLALSTDRTDQAYPTYRAVRLRLLRALHQEQFDQRIYSTSFCEEALAQISNQRRLCYQMRSVVRTVQQVKGGGHAKKNSALQQRLMLMSSGTGRRWRGHSLVGTRQSFVAGRSVALDATVAPTPSSSSSSRPQELLEAQGKGKARRLVTFAADTALHETLEQSLARATSAQSVISRQNSTLGHGQDEPRAIASARRFCPWLWRQKRGARPDPVKEEWDVEACLEPYENQNLDLLNLTGVSLPVDPSQALGRLDISRCFVANSAVAPVVLCYQADSPGSEDQALPCRYYAIKRGDDLRQDALVLQFFRLMETAWAEHGLAEVALMPYNVLALSPKEGFAAFVPKAKNLSSILQAFDGDVSSFIKKHCNGSVSASFDRLCGSTAGYCVATYLLGVGDRHLDNIMITEDGHFFHIDFGFVLGDDPKPGAPSVRVPREVLEALRNSGRYDRFRQLVGQAFTLVRRTARLWTALLSIASSAGGNGVSALQNDDDAERAIHTVRERLHLELDDDEAAAEIMAEVEEGAMAILPVIYDKLHQAGLLWH